MSRLYAPGDSPTYEQEPDARFERDHLQPCIHQGEPAEPRWRLAPDRRVPQVEYHPGPPYHGIPPLWWRRAMGEH